MVFKRLDEMGEIYNGVRTHRYHDEDGSEYKVFLPTPTNQISWQIEKLSSILDKKYFSQKNDIILNLRDPKIVEILDEENVVIPMAFAIIRLNKEYNPEYIYQILKSKHVQNKFNQYLYGTSLKFINLNILKNVPIEIPPRDIQNQYAKLFNSIDKKINLKNNEEILLNEFKNSLIQKINKNMNIKK